MNSNERAGLREWAESYLKRPELYAEGTILPIRAVIEALDALDDAEQQVELAETEATSVTAARVVLNLRAELLTLRADLENCHQQDSLKTREINTLTQENRVLRAELDAKTAEAMRLRKALDTAHWPISRIDEGEDGSRLPEDEQIATVHRELDAALSPTPATRAEVERVRAMERVVEEWPRVWVAFQKAEENIGVQIAARRRLNQLARDAIAACEKVSGK